jgi:CRISPR-associated protein Cas2
MSRRLYLVAYDVHSPRRLRHILLVLKDYASGGQKSAFECYLSAAEKSELIQRAEQLLDMDKDSFLLMPLMGRDAVDVLGRAIVPVDELYTYLG